MSTASVYTEIRTLLANAWTPATTIAWPNSEFTPPPLDSGEWVRLTIIAGESRQVELGGPLKTFRTTGVIHLDIFTPLNTGQTRGLTLGDTLATAFRNYDGVNLKCRAVTVKDLGADGEGWNMIKCLCPFLWDSIL